MGEREGGIERGMGVDREGSRKEEGREGGSEVGGSYRPLREPFAASSNPVLLPLKGAKKTK